MINYFETMEFITLNSGLGAEIVRPGAMDYAELLNISQQTGNYLLSCPEMYGVTVVDRKDIDLISAGRNGNNQNLLEEMSHLAVELMPEMPDAEIDRIKIISSPDSQIDYVRVGLKDDVLEHFQEERQRFFDEFAHKESELPPKHTFPFTIVPVRGMQNALRLQEHLYYHFAGGHVALKSAGIDRIKAPLL